MRIATYTIMRAIDLYDAAEGYESLAESFARIKCSKVFVASFNADWLFPSYQSQEIVKAMESNGINTEYHDVESPYGHDSFLLEYKQLTHLITNFWDY